MRSDDTFLVLSGPPKDDWRAPQAAAIYKFLDPADQPKRIIVTGNYTGMDDYASKPCCTPRVPDAQLMKQEMVRLGIPDEIIRVEPDALDTIENMVYSRPLLEEFDAHDILLITDDYHLPRSAWLAERILNAPRRGNGVRHRFNITPERTHKRGTYLDRATEIVLTKAIAHSTRKCATFEDFQEYLKSEHPFRAPRYGNRPPLSPYRLCVEVKRRI